MANKDIITTIINYNYIQPFEDSEWQTWWKHHEDRVAEHVAVWSVDHVVDNNTVDRQQRSTVAGHGLSCLGNLNNKLSLTSAAAESATIIIVNKRQLHWLPIC